MSDFPRFGEAFEGWVERVNELLNEWTPFITSVSAKIDAGTYDADAVSADFPTVAKLVSDSLIGLGAEAVDAVAILTADTSEVEQVTYILGAGKAGSTRALALKGDLASVTGPVLPKGRVKIKPDTLSSSDTRFTLEVNGDGLKARTYDGYVVVTTATAATANAPADVDEILVSVTIG
jgi:hypothetical protein